MDPKNQPQKREIKFRAWCREGEWEEESDKRQFEMIDADSLFFSKSEPLKDLLLDIPDEQYIMQYTGMKDSKDREIYEGDIVIGVGYKPHLIEWNNKGGLFNCKNIAKNDYGYNGRALFLMPYEFPKIEVIGNIYEKPYLLEPNHPVYSKLP